MHLTWQITVFGVVVSIVMLMLGMVVLTVLKMEMSNARDRIVMADIGYRICEMKG